MYQMEYKMYPFFGSDEGLMFEQVGGQEFAFVRCNPEEVESSTPLSCIVFATAVVLQTLEKTGVIGFSAGIER
jgi:hypothetical protein